MAYQKTNIPSSFQQNDLGKTLYDIVMGLRPKRIIEFGTLHGYSAIAMAQALQDIQFPDKKGRPTKESGHIVSYDLLNEYNFNRGDIEIARTNAKKYGVEDYITFAQGDLRKWSPEPTDMIFVDISNTGDTLKLIAAKFRGLDAVVYFEGGTLERDRVSWMVKYNKPPMISAGIKFDVVDDRFPGISKLV